MTTETISHQTALDAHLFIHAQGLIKYATQDEIFSESFAALVQKLPITPGRYETVLNEKQSFVTPSEISEAIITATWLLEEIQNQPTRTRHTAALLQNWSEPYKAPKDQVFGIVGIAIIGPTLGLIKKKKKKKSQLQVIVDSKWHQKHTEAELVSLVQRVSLGVISKELQMAGGNAYRLHPDSAEWCLNDPETKLYIDNNGDLSNIEAVTKGEKLSCFAQKENDQIIAIALSPTINESFTQDFSIKLIK